MGILDTMKVRRWMHHHIADYIDLVTGEISCTDLAEAACEEFQGYERDRVPESYFEAASDAADEYEKQHK